MKSGAGDDPFADESVDSDSNSEGEPEQETKARGEVSTQAEAAQEFPEKDDIESAKGSSEQQSTASAAQLPYKYRRSSVKEGRTQQPMFLQDDTETLIEDTLADIETQFDENVYKTDVVEAMIVAGGQETTPAAVLRRWGYGMKNE